jgi:hypothetical protein
METKLGEFHNSKIFLYFLLPAFARISAIHANVDMLSIYDDSHTLESTFSWPG